MNQAWRSEKEKEAKVLERQGILRLLEASERKGGREGRREGGRKRKGKGNYSRVQRMWQTQKSLPAAL